MQHAIIGCATFTQSEYAQAACQHAPSMLMLALSAPVVGCLRFHYGSRLTMFSFRRCQQSVPCTFSRMKTRCSSIWQLYGAACETHEEDSPMAGAPSRGPRGSSPTLRGCGWMGDWGYVCGNGVRSGCLVVQGRVNGWVKNATAARMQGHYRVLLETLFFRILRGFRFS